MNPTWKYFLVAAVLLAAPLAAAQTGPIRIALRDTSVTGGTSFSYPVYVDSSLSGLGVTAYELELTFSTTYLTFVGVSKTGTLTESWNFVEASEISSGRIRVAGSGSDTIAGTGKLVVLQFQAKLFTFNLNTSVSFASALLNEGTPATTTRNGNVQIQVPPFITVSPDTWLMTKGETKQFTVSGGTGPYAWSTTDPAVASINNSGLLTSLNPGFVRVVCTDSLGVIDSSGTVEIRGLKLSVRDTSVFQGQTLDLPIATTSLTGLNITAGQFTVTFNQNLWTATGLVSAGTLLASSSPEYAAGSGTISVSFAGSTPLAGSGTLIVIRLVATSSTWGSSNIGFSNAVFNEDLPANTQSGTATVTQLATLNVTPGGSQQLVKGDSLQFNVTGGTPPFVWSVSHPQLATITAGGLLRVLRGGSVIVSVQDSNGALGMSGTVNLYDFRLKVPSFSQFVHTALDTAVEFPLTITANDTGFYAFQFQLTYPTNYSLVLDSVLTGGTLTNGWNVVPAYGSGLLQVAAANTNPVTSAGTLLKLRFRVSASTPRPSTTSLALSNVLFNEGSPIPLVENGYLQIRSTNAKPVFLSKDPSSLDSAFTGSPTQFSVSANDPDGDALTYQWKVNGVVEQTGTSNMFVKLFTSNSASTTVVAVFQDPWGAKDSTSWSFKIVTNVERGAPTLPDGFTLFQNYPNPFNPSTGIRYQISGVSRVVLKIFNTLGEEVATLVDREVSPGYYQVEWSATVPSGVYFYRMETVGVDGQRFVVTKKMVLLR